MRLRSFALTGLFCCIFDSGLRASDTDAKRRASEHYRQASRLFVAAQYQRAAEELSQSLALDPKQLRATKLLGICQQLLNDLEGATRTFTLATKIDPRDTEAWFFLGRVYWVQNFFDKALAALESAARLDQRDYRIRECLGLTFEALGDHDRALPEFREAVRQNGARRKPSHTPPLNYGAFLFKIGQLGESEAQLKRSIELKADDWQAHFELGKLYNHIGKLELAAEELRAALATETGGKENRSRIYRVLARVYVRLGREEDAARVILLAEQ